MNRRRVVVTGIGAVTPLGLDFESSWAGMLEGRSGARPITHFDVSEHPTKFCTQVVGFDPSLYFSGSEARKLDVYAQYLLAAADEAVKNAQFDVAKTDPTRAGCILGTGIGGIQELEAGKDLFAARGPRRISPFFIPKMMSNSVAGFAAIRFGLQGSCFSTSSACASAGHAIGQAMRAIQYDEADMMLTGGSEAATTALSLAGFCSLKALSKRNDEPERASRPFDNDRDGFVMGEGSAAIVIEELEHAKKRGAPILAELIGYGSTDDAHHITAPQEDGAGAVRAIQQALGECKIDPARVTYVNAHGTSTQLNDKMETAALKQSFGEHAKKLQISSTKSMIGHLLGASGAVEMAVCAQAIAKGQLPPTINQETPDPNCDLDYIPNEARDQVVDVAISNSFGFGGHNTCLALARFEQ
ncbi:MAG: beta-ketoacyl-ACP synthase II [Planctomycetota bacterium]